MRKLKPYLSLPNFLRVFTLVIFLMTLKESYFMWGLEYQKDELIWPTYLLRVDLWGTLPMKIALVLCSVSLLMFLKQPLSFFAQVFWGSSYFFWVALIHSRGYIYQSFHSSLIFFLLLPLIHFAGTKKEFKSLAPLQPLFFLPYCLAGFWKVYDMTRTYRQNQPGIYEWDSFSNILALRAVETGFENPVLTFLVQYNTIAQLLLWALIAIQFSSLIVMFIPKLYWTWGIFFVVFHLLTPFMLDFQYHPAAFANFWGLVILSLAIDWESKRPGYTSRPA